MNEGRTKQEGDLKTSFIDPGFCLNWVSRNCGIKYHGKCKERSSAIGCLINEAILKAGLTGKEPRKRIRDLALQEKCPYK